jgi:hypothetical protein
MSDKKKRWTTEKMKEYLQFCGYEVLEQLLNNMKVIYEEKLHGLSGEILLDTEKEVKACQNCMVTTFVTGSRIGEVLGQEFSKRYGYGSLPEDLEKYKNEKMTEEILEKHPELSGIAGLYSKHFQETETSFIVTVNLEKKYKYSQEVQRFRATDDSEMRWDTKLEAIQSGRPFESYKGFTTKRKRKIRRVSIPKGEPFAEKMYKFAKSRNGKLFPELRYNKFYRVITKAGDLEDMDFPPHRLRAERATQFVLEYGMDIEDLVDWFSWEEFKQALEYASLAPKVSEKMEKAVKEKYGS